MIIFHTNLNYFLIQIVWNLHAVTVFTIFHAKIAIFNVWFPDGTIVKVSSNFADTLSDTSGLSYSKFMKFFTKVGKARTTLTNVLCLRSYEEKSYVYLYMNRLSVIPLNTRMRDAWLPVRCLPGGHCGSRKAVARDTTTLVLVYIICANSRVSRDSVNHARHKLKGRRYKASLHLSCVKEGREEICKLG